MAIKLHRPGTVIIGAHIVDHTIGKWEYPKPLRYVYHFRSMWARGALKRGEITRSKAMISVPVFRGTSAFEMNRVRSAMRQAEKRMKEKSMKENLNAT